MSSSFNSDINKLLSVDGRICDQKTFNRIKHYIDGMDKIGDIKELNVDYYKVKLLDIKNSIFFDVVFYLKGDRNEPSPFKFNITNQGRYEYK